MTDEQLLEEYSKKIYGTHYYGSTDNVNVASLIESHSNLRKIHGGWNGASGEAIAEGYKIGYEWAVKNAAKNTIMLEDLRKMTLQEIANLIGTEND